MIKYWQPGGNEGPNDGEDNKPEGEIQKRFLSILTWMTGSEQTKDNLLEKKKTNLIREHVKERWKPGVELVKRLQRWTFIEKTEKHNLDFHVTLLRKHFKIYCSADTIEYDLCHIIYISSWINLDCRFLIPCVVNSSSEAVFLRVRVSVVKMDKVGYIKLSLLPSTGVCC